VDDLRWGLVTVVLAVVGVALSGGAGGMWIGLLGMLAANLGAFTLAHLRRRKRLAAASDGEAPPGPGAWFDVLGAGWSAILVSMIVATGLQYLSHEAALETWAWLLSALPAAAAPIALAWEGIARTAGGYRRLVGREVDAEEEALPGGDTDRLSSRVFLPLVVPLLLLSATVASAQLPESDRSQVARVALDAVADSLNPPLETDGRLWLHEWATRTESGWTSETISDATLPAVQGRYPEARIGEGDLPDFFLCPEGVQLSMPGSGCPIRDDGRIVGFMHGPERDPPNGIWVAVRVHSTACGGTCSWKVTWLVELRKDEDGRWWAARSAMYSIT